MEITVSNQRCEPSPSSPLRIGQMTAVEPCPESATFQSWRLSFHPPGGGWRSVCCSWRCCSLASEVLIVERLDPCELSTEPNRSDCRMWGPLEGRAWDISWSFVWIELPTYTLGRVQIPLELGPEEDEAVERGGGTLPCTSGKGVDAAKVRRWRAMTPTVAGICIRARAEVVQEDVFDLVWAVVLDVMGDGVGERSSGLQPRLALSVCSNRTVGGAGRHVVF